MHELSIARSVVRTVTAAAGGQRVVRVRMRVGALSGVVPDAVAFAWDVATEGTVLAGAALDVDPVLVTVACRDCRATSELDEPLPLRCGDCGARAVEIVAGHEVEVVSADVDDGPDRADPATATAGTPPAADAAGDAGPVAASQPVAAG